MEQSLSAHGQNKVLHLHTRTIHKPTEPSDIALSAKFRHCEPFIGAALKHAHGSHTLSDVFLEITKGNAQFWFAQDAGLVTEIINYPRRRTLRFWLAGGHIETLKKMEIDAIEWSKGWDCTSSEIIGRRGWVRALDGYEVAATVGVKSYE